MCIAILKTKKGIITDSALRNSFISNPDGSGIAYTVNNQLIIEKGIFDIDEFVNAVRKAEKICDNNMLIHCRIGTSGSKNELNTHPFYVNDDVCLMHNGILDISVPSYSKINDTQIYINRYLKGLNKSMLMHSKNLHKLIENSIGKRNKFVLMDNKGYYKILNEKAGQWENNVWYSNTSYTYNLFYDDVSYISEDELSEEEKEEILWTIYNADIPEFEYLGEFPIYDRKRKLLLSSDNMQWVENKNLVFLEDDLLYEYELRRAEILKETAQKVQGCRNALPF